MLFFVSSFIMLSLCYSLFLHYVMFIFFLSKAWIIYKEIVLQLRAMAMAVGSLVQAIKGTVFRIDLICELEYLCKRATKQIPFV